MGPALRGAAVIQGGRRRPPLQGRTGTAQNGTSRTPSPTHSVIARSEATRQSVLPSPKKRIPAPVCTPRALASRRALAQNDSAARWERRDTWIPPYGVRRSSRAGGGVRPYSGTSGAPSPTHSVIARSEATRQSVLPSPKGRIPAPVCTPRALASRRALARNDSAPRWERRDTWVPPYGVRRSSRAGRVVRPYNGTSRTPSPTKSQGVCARGGQGRPPLQRGGEGGKIPKFFLPPVRFGGAAAFI